MTTHRGRLLRWLAAGGLLYATVSAQAGLMSLDGQFSVSESGAATYTIPLQVPPGTGGIEPKLALTYNSQSGNGLLGVGWNLSGLSAIGRCPRTLAQDGVRGSVNFDANDRYCLDGQRLLLVSGSYGADGAEYRTEREGYSKIVSYGTAGNGPAWFRVWTKAGQVIEYGNTADSRIEAEGISTVRLWAQNKLSDTKGNYLNVLYVEDVANGDFWPSRIDFSGNAVAALSPYASVRLIYEAKPANEIVSLYEAGHRIRSVQRLKTVQTWEGGTLLSEYRITFDLSASTGRSRVNAVRRCAGDGSCQPATGFGWSTPAEAWASHNNASAADGGLVGYIPLLGDFDGDGRTDVLWNQAADSSGMRQIWISKGDGTFSVNSNPMGANGSYWNYAPSVADFNGDGIADLLWDIRTAASSTGSGGYRIVWLGKGDGTFVVIGNAAGADGALIGHVPVFADFDGDGRTDILWNQPAGSSGNRALWLSKGDGSFVVNSNPMGRNGTYWNYEPMVGDFNGDGLADIFWDIRMPAYPFGSGGYRILWLGKGDGTFTVIGNAAGADTALQNYQALPGDFNGDGKTDIWWNRRNASDGSSDANGVLWLSNGSGGFAIINPPAGFTGYARYEPTTADFNGDGKADVLWDIRTGSAPYGSGGYRILWLGNGDGTSTIINIAEANGGLLNHVALPGDFNGDGKADILWDQRSGSAGSAGKRTLWFREATATDLLTSAMVSSGDGASTQINYVTSVAPAIYVKDATAIYPVRDLAASITMVSSASSNNGLGGTLTTNYKYGGLKAELGTGRGLLGFNWIEATQAETGLVTRTEYRQDWPYVGLPSVVKKTHPSAAGPNKQLSLINTTYACLNPATGGGCTVAAGNRYFPYANQSVESSWDLNGTALPVVTTSNQFDAWGNATQITVSTGDGHSKTTTNIYQNDSGNWYLGRLLRSQVQSTAP